MKVLIVIDMQKDFISGSLGTKEAKTIVKNVVTRIESSNSELILFTQDTHGDDYLSTPEGQKLPVPHCIEGSAGWQIEPTIIDAWRNNKNTIISNVLSENTFKKPIFGSVDLVEFLKARESDIDEIELLGVCTDICVVSNALMIKSTLPNVKISVNAACCAGVTPESHEAALLVMKMCQVDAV